MILKLRIVPVAVVILLMVSCNNGPKVISSDSSNKSEENSGVSTDESSKEYMPMPNQSLGNEMHKVIVLEILPTTKYVYLKVKEDDEEFWIATAKGKIDIGGTYYYKGGLLKKNFESKEYNKTFEKIYLVTALVQANHGNNDNVGSEDIQQKNMQNSASKIKEISQKSGSITIAELVKNHIKYEGKMVQISGKCVKINPNIMNRNWIHIKDGTKDDYDMVITSDTFVKEGEVITIKGTLSLNKDFGAGYKYDLIIENAVIIP